MPASVSRQKINLPALQLSADQRIRGGSKWSVDLMLGRIAQLFHLIQAAPADDSDCLAVVVFHSRKVSGLNLKDRHVGKSIMAKTAGPCIIFARPCRNFSSKLTVAR